jgi:hypothetical protein
MSIVEVEPAATGEVSHSPFSWSAAIAGMFAAIAVSFIVAALGSGIGLSVASPYSGPSATALAAAAAVWLVMSETFGFAVGGYLAGRLRSPAYDGIPGETVFRDAAQGFVVWALGVVIMASIVVASSYLAASSATQAAGSLASTITMARSNSDQATGTTTDYFVDVLFRPGPSASPNGPATVGNPGAAPPALSPEMRSEVTRILGRSLVQGQLDDNDRMYLAQMISARTGLPPDQAEQRVSEVATKARDTVKAAADKAASAGAYLSFWTFLSLLFGGTAATLAGVLGGQLRDAEGRMPDMR